MGLDHRNAESVRIDEVKVNDVITKFQHPGPGFKVISVSEVSILSGKRTVTLAGGQVFYWSAGRIVLRER